MYNLPQSTIIVISSQEGPSPSTRKTDKKEESNDSLEPQTEVENGNTGIGIPPLFDVSLHFLFDLIFSILCTFLGSNLPLSSLGVLKG